MEVQGDNVTEATKSTQAVESKTTEQVSESQQTKTNEEQAVEQADLGWSEDQKAYIKGLRDENAKYRTRAKDLESKVTETSERLGKFETGLKTLFGEEGDELSPEERVEALQAQNEQLAVQSAMKEAAFEYGIGRDSYEYFEFLVSKRLNDLEEGEEITEEDLEDIAKSANSRTANSSTSVGTDANGNPAPIANEGSITLDAFMEMGIGEKSVLYQKDKALYESLANQERAAKKPKR